MTTERLEAFTDGVIAIIITIMVLELHAPVGAHLNDLRPLAPVLGSYALSFVFMGIYWNNHHHMFHSVEHVDGAVLWANLHLLFWLSMTPLATAWMGSSGFATVPVAAYGVVLMLAGIAYFILTLVLVRANGPTSKVAIALGRDFKGKVSVLVYLVAVPLAFATRLGASALYVMVATMWLVPDRRFAHPIDEVKTA